MHIGSTTCVNSDKTKFDNNCIHILSFFDWLISKSFIRRVNHTFILDVEIKKLNDHVIFS